MTGDEHLPQPVTHEPLLTAARPNRVKRILADGGVSVGCLLAYDAPWLVEVLGITGHDFVTIDLEHEPISDESVANLVRAADGVGLTSIARMSLSDRVFPVLSTGVQGLQVPDVRDRKHAEEIVEMALFPPRGRRTYYTQTRAAQYGVGIDEMTWTERANEQMMIIAMIEDAAVLDELDEILAVDGIDALHVGTLDLAQSLGSPTPDRVDEVVAEILKRGRAAGKAVAVGVVPPWGVDSIEKRIEQGVQIINVPSAWLLTHAVGAFLIEIERRIPDSQRAKFARTVSPNPYVTSRP